MNIYVILIVSILNGVASMLLGKTIGNFGIAWTVGLFGMAIIFTVSDIMHTLRYQHAELIALIHKKTNLVHIPIGDLIAVFLYLEFSL